MPVSLLLAILAAGTAVPLGDPAPDPTDDLVPTAIEVLLTQPLDAIAFGLPPGVPSPRVFDAVTGRIARVLLDVGDVTGDGAPDLAVGYGPGPVHWVPNLEVRDGRTGERLWGARAGLGFRSMRALAVDGGRLATAPESIGGVVECRDTATGTLIWRRTLAPDLLVTLHAVTWVDDSSGDGQPDLLVAGGRGLDELLLLSGADGATEWCFPAGDVTYDVATWRDADGDGLDDLVSTGGDDVPFVRIHSSAHGEIIAEAALAGTGAVLLPVDDIGGDGEDDLVIGMFNEPGTCLTAVDGQSLATLWDATTQVRNVTSLDTIHDIDSSGARDVVVGSFDNAAVAVFASHGFFAWRREVSTFNGGHMLAVAAIGDVDGNGSIDVAAGSFDGQAYVMGGNHGQFIAVTPMRNRQVGAVALGDGNGDGRSEWAAAGIGTLTVFGGEGGLATGPVVTVDAVPDGGEYNVTVAAFPGTGLFVFLSNRTADIPVPGLEGSLGLDPGSLVFLLQGTAPGAGVAGFIAGPFPYFGDPFEVFVQAATLYSPDFGKFSNVASFLVTR